MLFSLGNGYEVLKEFFKDVWLNNHDPTHAAYGTYRLPKQIADEMGHDLETHLKSYSRFNTKDLENAFDSVNWKLEKKIEKVKN